MKKLILVLSMATAFAANAADLSQAQEQVAHDSRYGGIAQSHVDAAEAAKSQKHDLSHTMQSDRDAMNKAATERANFESQVKSDQMNLANLQAQQAQVANSYNVSATSYRLGIVQREQATINVAAGSLPANTPVTDSTGKKDIAGNLPAGTQVAVPHVAAFVSNTGKGSKNDKGGSSSGGSNSNGANNAAGTNSAHGLGGGQHIGGGSSMNGGFHGGW